MVPVEEEPVLGVGVVVTEQPGASSGVVDQTLAMLDGLADEGGRGSLEFLGRWNEKRSIFGASILGASNLGISNLGASIFGASNLGMSNDGALGASGILKSIFGASGSFGASGILKDGASGACAHIDQ